MIYPHISWTTEKIDWSLWIVRLPGSMTFAFKNPGSFQHHWGNTGESWRLPGCLRPIPSEMASRLATNCLFSRLHQTCNFQALKTTVLLTGGLCSKLFGIGLMGYLAFQSMQAGPSQVPSPWEDWLLGALGAISGKFLGKRPSLSWN